MIYLKIIRQAIENECYIDLYDAKQIGLPNQWVIPRPSRYKKILETRRGRVFAWTVRKMWWLGFTVLIVDILRDLLMRSRISGKVLGKVDCVFVSAEKHGTESISAYSKLDEFKQADGLIFTAPVLIQSKDPRSVSALQIFNYKELLAGAWRSILVYSALVRVSSDPLFLLHLARIWRATIGCMLMDKLNGLGVGTVVHSNHYDTNAVIIHNVFKNRIILIQHGQVRQDLVPPIRIRPPAKLYTLDVDSEGIFRSCILNEPKAIIEIVPYRKFLAFSDAVPKGFIILIASRPGDADAEMKYIADLHQRKLENINLLVKPHPMLSGHQVYPRTFREQYRVTIWETRNTFPRSHLLVCGRSTMRIEFEACGIPVLDIHGTNTVNQTCELYSKMVEEVEKAGR